MFAVTSPSKPPAPAPRPAPVHQRSIGALDLVISRDAQGSRPMRIYENGCMKARFPKAPGRDPHAVLVNLAGGLTGGDVIDMAVTLTPGASATVTSQAYERIYRSLGDDVRIAVRLDIGEGASLSWLPQPTLIFDGGCLKRETTIALAPGASLLMIEAVIFGRTEMGEDVTHGRISDACAVRVGERLIQADRFVCSGGVNNILDRSAVLGGCRAMATLRYVAADAEAQLPAMRGLLDGVGGMAGASAWDGLLLARFAAADGYALTRDLQHVLNGFRGGVLPRMWLF